MDGICRRETYIFSILPRVYMLNQEETRQAIFQDRGWGESENIN